MANYRLGEILKVNNQRYEYIKTNPDESLLVRVAGTSSVLSIPDHNIVKESINSGNSIYSGKLRG